MLFVNDLNREAAMNAIIVSDLPFDTNKILELRQIDKETY